MSNNPTRTHDIPWPLALLLLGTILGFIAIGFDLTKMEVVFDRVNTWVDQNAFILCVSALALGLNMLTSYAYIQRTLSQKKQGKKLRDLLGDKDKKEPISWKKLLYLAMTWESYVIVFALLDKPFGPSGPTGSIFLLLLVNAATAATTLSLWSWRIGHQILVGKASTDLPPLPQVENTIALGTYRKNTEDEKETWATVGSKALNGNILITGSIGSGKTQGTILPYFDQILKNSALRPAVLAIDPKGTFVRDAMKMAGTHGALDKVLHLHLAGKVTFNPIFVDSVLKNGRFLDVTQMIRSAAINFSGRGSGDSPFWELSAFNLTKNALVLIAAVKGYYTLADLYRVMLDAVESRASDKLEEALRVKLFDDEETHNIRQALSYFSQEFPSFDPKVKTGILATATSFLNQFQEFRASRIFCPPEAERTIKIMDQVVDDGQLLFFDITNPGLARAMGTFVKLQFQQSVLNRLVEPARSKERSALLIIDEYQDVVSSGYGTMMGDDRFLAKGREANAMTIAATQSLSSLENSLGRAEAAKELGQNFRTRIACHSTDLLTIRTFQDLVGEEDRAKRSHSFSEMSHDAKRNLILGGFEAENANISESISMSLHRESTVTGKDFSALSSFEALALVYDGFKTQFVRLNLKPYFLKKRHTSHVELRQMLGTTAAMLAFMMPIAQGYPNVCDVVKAPTFSSCLDYQISSCVCPGIPPRPCARFTYYLPDTYIEVAGGPGQSKFSDLPGVRSQLLGIKNKAFPFGTEGEDFAAFEARTLAIPLASMMFNGMPCGASFQDTACFGAMSEHLGSKWTTGSGDLKQPNYLLWANNPKACLELGAARSVAGGNDGNYSKGSPACSIPMESLSIYPPSTHAACTGWGTFYPRSGIYDGPSQTTAALMVASRMKSLSSEIFQSAPSSPDEKWQMILPSTSLCFTEGQNVSFLESSALVNDRGRLKGNPKDYLFAVWRKVSCCQDYTEVPVTSAVLASMKSSCQGMGGLR